MGTAFPLADPSAPSFINVAAIVGLGLTLFGLIGLFVALQMGAKSSKTNPKAQAQTAMNFGLAAVVAAIAVGGSVIAYATGVLDYLFQS
ncbi:MAG: hypothetical protein ACRC35_11275 [Angustibacter sp.]